MADTLTCKLRLKHHYYHKILKFSVLNLWNTWDGTFIVYYLFFRFIEVYGYYQVLEVFINVRHLCWWANITDPMVQWNSCSLHQHGIPCTACCAVKGHDCSCFVLPSHMNFAGTFFEMNFDTIIWCVYWLDLSVFHWLNHLGNIDCKSAVSKDGDSY